ncbi:MAG: hypothetical protein WBE26_04520, partial [Phycisphaerae bacterium]
PALQHCVNDFFAVQRDFVARATTKLNREPEAARASKLRMMLARVRLLAAEVQVLPQVDRPTQALETLAGFEDDYPGEQNLDGRVWHVRLLAYERLGQLDEATRAIPAYIAADPDNAGATLQSLYASLAVDAERCQAEGDTISAQRTAEVALVLAQQIHEWAARPDNGSDATDRRALTVQLAEANLRAGRYERARELFEPLVTSDASSLSPETESDLRVVFGHAEALFQLGEYASGLPEFARLATRLPPTDPIRWKSLLRDLQCRTALDHPPQGVIKVIQQQKYLYPDLGGPVLAAQFEKLQRENKRRADESRS